MKVLVASRLLVHADCLSHTYPDGTPAIHRLCFKVYEREIVCLCGPNGSGKSTLLEHLNGLLLPTEGRLEILGKNANRNNLKEIRKEVGLVFQDAESQLFSPTVLDDVMFGPINLGMDFEEARRRALWALETVGFTEHMKIPHYLSGGEKRLVAIAGVIAMKPRLLALDEPTSDLDSKNATRIENLILMARNDLGMSVIVATHDCDLAARVADRICITKGGNVIGEGTPAEVFYDEKLMDSANLHPPAVVQLYQQLYQRGHSRGMPRRPVRTEDLVEILKTDLHN